MKDKKINELAGEQLDNVTGGGTSYTVWYNKNAVRFKYNIGDEVEVYDEPYLFRCTTKRYRITSHVYYHDSDSTKWHAGYEGEKVADTSCVKRFEEWEIEGYDA